MGARGGQKRVLLDPLNLELQAVVNHHVGGGDKTLRVGSLQEQVF